MSIFKIRLNIIVDIYHYNTPSISILDCWVEFLRVFLVASALKYTFRKDDLNSMESVLSSPPVAGFNVGRDDRDD